MKISQKSLFSRKISSLLMNKKILTSTLVLVIFVTTASMTMPLVSAQQNDTNSKMLQNVLKSSDVQALIGPTDQVLNVICPANAANPQQDCQVFRGTQVGGPIDPQGNLMAPGDTLLTGICPTPFDDVSQCQLFRGTPTS
jgi:hypothetical protein